MRARQQFLRAFIEEAKDGKFFTVEFVKKDGSIRKMNARLGVKLGLTGKGMTWNPTQKGLLPVYDMQKGGYRMINFSTVKSVAIHGRRVKVISL